MGSGIMNAKNNMGNKIFLRISFPKKWRIRPIRTIISENPDEK
jgi:hypothetical protein